VVRSHYHDGKVTPDRFYRASNAIAEWLGLYGWVEIGHWQHPDRKAEFRTMIENAQ
jgi:hypothetical protein